MAAQLIVMPAPKAKPSPRPSRHVSKLLSDLQALERAAAKIAEAKDFLMLQLSVHGINQPSK